jgi:hypothetical protein
MRRLNIFLLAFAFVAASAGTAEAACSPLGKTRGDLELLKASEWKIASEADRNALALAMTPCLGDPDPVVRDDIATDGLTHLLRGQQLSDATMLALMRDLEMKLEAPDPQGFLRPFAALNLSEVVRADRVKPFMTVSQREGVMMASINYMLRITDYRGFDAREGYRHGVAHGADLMMQLAMNPGIDTKGLAQIRAALSVQAGTSNTSYVTGEGERLARALLMIAKRKVFSDADWTDWATRLASPAALKTWDKWWLSEAALARRHNLLQVFASLYITTTAGSDPDLAALRPAVLAGLKALP